MDPKQEGAKEGSSFDELQKLLDEEPETQTPESSQDQEATNAGKSDSPEQKEETPIDQTKAFARRLKEETTKIRQQERETMAKELGYNNYAEFLQSKEKKSAEEKGLDPDAFSEVFNKLYEERVANDPRMRELEEYRNAKATEWANSQLKELTELTGGQITSIDQIGKDVFEAVKPGGSLVDAYMSIHGREVIANLKAAKATEQAPSTTQHLTSPGQTPTKTAYRDLNQQEFNIMSQFASFSEGMQKDLDEGKIKIKK